MIRPTKQNSRGFTLIELLVSMTLMAILLTYMLAGYHRQTVASDFDSFFYKVVTLAHTAQQNSFSGAPGNAVGAGAWGYALLFYPDSTEFSALNAPLPAHFKLARVVINSSGDFQYVTLSTLDVAGGFSTTITICTYSNTCTTIPNNQVSVLLFSSPYGRALLGAIDPTSGAPTMPFQGNKNASIIISNQPNSLTKFMYIKGITSRISP